MKEKEYDVFISYSSKDSHVAFMLCEALEAEEIICWIAPRNVKAGHYATSIVEGLEASKIFILLFSQSSNDSTPVLNELEMAMGNKLLIIPIRIEDVLPSKAMKFYLMSTHWFDILKAKSIEDFNEIVKTIKINLNKTGSLSAQYSKVQKIEENRNLSLKKILIFIGILGTFLSLFIFIPNIFKIDNHSTSPSTKITINEPKNNLEVNMLSEQLTKEVQEKEYWKEEYFNLKEKYKKYPQLIVEAEEIKKVKGYEEAVSFFIDIKIDEVKERKENIVLKKIIEQTKVLSRTITEETEVLSNKQEFNHDCHSMTNYEILTGSKTGTYYQIGLDLAKYVAPDACIKLKVLNSNGSMDNVNSLLSPKYPKLKFVIVQNDVLQKLRKLSEKGNEKAISLVDSLRVIAPLYNEEIHILVNTNSKIKTFAELRDKRISIGRKHSGTAMTSRLLYNDLFDEELINAKTQPFNKALDDLHMGSIDAIIKVGGQPILRLTSMTENASKYIKLLSYDEENINDNIIKNHYITQINASHYEWIIEDTPTLSTKAYLVTYNYKNLETKKHIKRFTQSLKNKLPILQKNATKKNDTPHMKWKEVPLDDETLVGGWKYYDVTLALEKWKTIPSGNEGRNHTYPLSPLERCSDMDKVIGLCEE